MLAVRRCIATIDVIMGCRKEITSMVDKKEGTDYLLAVKDNREGLYGAVSDFLKLVLPPGLDWTRPHLHIYGELRPPLGGDAPVLGDARHRRHQISDYDLRPPGTNTLVMVAGGQRMAGSTAARSRYCIASPSRDAAK